MTQMIESRSQTAYSSDIKHQNVGTGDRVLSALVGTAILRGAGKRSGAGRLLATTAGTMLLTRAATGHSQVYDRLGVSSAALKKGAGIDIEASVTILRPVEVVYAFFHEPTNLPLVMRHVESVTPVRPGVTHWRVRGPRDMIVEWDSRILNMQANDYIAWESLPGSDIEHAGSVHFNDAGDKGTEVLLRMRYTPAGSAMKFAAARVLNAITELEVAEDLRRLKHVMETGVDITAQGQPQGVQGGAVR